MSETVEVKGKPIKPIPADTLIENLRVWSSYGYYTSGDYRKFEKKAIKSLKGVGVVVIGDLKGISQKRIEALPGWGPATVERLMKAAKFAEVEMRFAGFPWEVWLKIDVPNEQVPFVKTLGKSRMENVFSAEIKWDDLKAEAEKQERRKMEDKRNSLKSALKNAEAELKALEKEQK